MLSQTHLEPPCICWCGGLVHTSKVGQGRDACAHEVRLYMEVDMFTVRLYSFCRGSLCLSLCSGSSTPLSFVLMVPVSLFLTSTKGRTITTTREDGATTTDKLERGLSPLSFVVLYGGSPLLSLSFFLTDPLSPFCGSYVPDFFGGPSPTFYELVPPKRRCCF